MNLTERAIIKNIIEYLEEPNGGQPKARLSVVKDMLKILVKGEVEEDKAIAKVTDILVKGREQ